jgi:hypothetical protein
MIALSLWPRRFGNSYTWTKPLHSMTDSGIVDIHTLAEPGISSLVFIGIHLCNFLAIWQQIYSKLAVVYQWISNSLVFHGSPGKTPGTTTASISIPMSTRMIFESTFGYHMMFPLLRDTSQKPGCNSILLSHHMLTIPLSPLSVLFFFLVVVFRHPRDEVTYVWRDGDGCLRISLHRRRSKSHSRAI